MDGDNSYDLGERTFQFANDVRAFTIKIPKRICNVDDIKQLNRASGSVGANYIEANESFSRKDFRYRIKICRKESKESRYWLKLLYIPNASELDEERRRLINESTELLKIFSTILSNTNKQKS